MTVIGDFPTGGPGHTPEILQRRRTLRVMDLFTESLQAQVRGDRAAARDHVDAAMGVDGLAVTGLLGGMLIGEVPNPERDWNAWIEYVEDYRSALADLEAAHD